MIIGKEFIKARELLKFTQNDLAKELGVSFATINRIENGVCVPRKSTLDAFRELCNKRGISFNEKNDNWCKVITSEAIKAAFLENKYNSVGLFPSLIEELIKETGINNIKKKEIPSLSDIYMPGFDLTLECSSSNRFIPNGKSVWELGVRENANGKIIGDFTKRTKEYDEGFKHDNIYIGCTPFTIQEVKKQKIYQECISSGWKDARIYDSLVLEDWLSYCPNTTAWFMEKFFGINISYRSFKTEFTKLINLTNPELSTEIFIKERSDEVKKLINLIIARKRVISINGPSFRESFGFVMSSIQSTSDIDTNSIVVVDDIKTLSKLQKYVDDKIFILKEINEVISFDEDDTNIYIIFKSNKEEFFGSNLDITLSLRSKEVIRDVLTNEMCIDSNKADRILIKTGSSVLNVMKEISREGSGLFSDWEKRSDLVNLIPIVFSGKINFNNQKDRDILSLYLENKSVDAYHKELMDWKDVDNTPLFFLDDYISVNCKSELWFLLKNKITNDDIKKVVDNLEVIFANYDPKYELKKEERIFASLKNKKWEYESYQISCMLDTLKLFAIYNDRQNDVDVYIRNILKLIKNKEQTLTISHYFCDIVECSPTEFISFVENELSKENGGIISFLFEETSDDFFAEKYYPSLLVALEKCTCFEETKFGALTCLLKLANIKFDYGNNMSPLDYLTNKLLPYNNNSSLSLNDKKQFIINVIEKNKTNVELLVSKLLAKDSFYEGVGLFLYREPVCTNTVTCGEIWEFRNEILNKTIKHSNSKDKTIVYLLDKCHYYFSNIEYGTIINYVKLDDCNKTLELYESFVFARYYLDEKNKGMIKKLSYIIDEIKPNNELDENIIYLSSNIYDCPLYKLKDLKIKDREEKVIEDLVNIVNTLRDKYKINRIIREIYKKDNNVDLNWLYESIIFDENELNDISQLFIEKKKYYELSKLLLKYVDFGKSKIRKYEKSILKELLAYFGMFKCKDLLEIDDLLNNEEYLRLYYLNFHIDKETNSYEIDMVKKYNVFAYFEYAAYSCDINTLDINELLDLLIAYPIEKNRNHDIYVIEKIIKCLDDMCKSDKLALLEYRYMLIFNSDLPKCLTWFFFENPYVLLSLYEGVSGSKPVNKENISQAWFKLKFNLKLPDNYAADMEMTRKFIYTLINYKKDNVDVNEYIKEFVGEILARSSEIEDYCPSINMITLLEEYYDDAIARGFAVGYSNAKGVRTVTDGSDLQKNSKRFKETAIDIEVKYPNTAKIIKRIAEDEDFFAQREKVDWLDAKGLI